MKKIKWYAHYIFVVIFIFVVHSQYVVDGMAISSMVWQYRHCAVQTTPFTPLIQKIANGFLKLQLIFRK